MTVVTLEHLSTIRGFSTTPGFCRRLARAWFARHGLDWAAFRHGGLPAEAFLATGCALGAALVAHAQGRAADAVPEAALQAFALEVDRGR